MGQKQKDKGSVSLRWVNREKERTKLSDCYNKKKTGIHVNHKHKTMKNGNVRKPAENSVYTIRMNGGHQADPLRFVYTTQTELNPR